MQMGFSENMVQKKLYGWNIFPILKPPFDHLGVDTIFRHSHIVFNTDMHVARNVHLNLKLHVGVGPSAALRSGRR